MKNQYSVSELANRFALGLTPEARARAVADICTAEGPLKAQLAESANLGVRNKSGSMTKPASVDLSVAARLKGYAATPQLRQLGFWQASAALHDEMGITSPVNLPLVEGFKVRDEKPAKPAKPAAPSA